MTDAVAVPIRQNTAEWEEARLDGIGSSDAPVIAGERGSVVALWAAKTRQAPAEEIDADTRAMFDLGHRLEPVVADVYTERVGRPVRRVNRMLRRREDPWAFASLDRVSAVKGERRIVELKTAPWSTWGVGEPVPGDVQAQVQHQLWVTGYDVADVVVLHRGYDLQIHEVGRDDGFIDDLVYLEREFWQWVQTRSRPPVDGSELTRKALQRMFPDEYGEVLPATPEFDELAERLYIETALFNSAKNRLGTTKNAIRFLLGEAQGVAGADWKITWKKSKDGSETNWQGVATAYRSLLEMLGPDPAPLAEAIGYSDAEAFELVRLLNAIESLHTNKKQGTRRLTPWWKGRKPIAEEQEETAA
jgi:putative phage-type endonuclease